MNPESVGRNRFAESQAVAILKQANSGLPIKDLRKYASISKPRRARARSVPVAAAMTDGTGAGMRTAAP